MDVAIVTGAASALGAALARALIDEGMRVYGLGGDYREMPFNNENFRPMPCDLARPDEVSQAAGKILHEEGGVALLVHNAKVYPAQPFAESEPDLLQQTLLVNQLTPLLLTRVLLPGLLQVRGAVVNIAPGLESAPRGGPAGALSAGGMRAFHNELAREFFAAGLRVTTLCPEPWRKDEVALHEGQKASPFDATEIAKILCTVMRNPDALQTTEIIVRPGAPRDAKALPVRELPKPPTQPVPYTVPREQIEAEELLEEAERAEKEGRNLAGRRRSHRSSEHERRMRMVAQLLAAEAAMAEADEDGEMPDFNKVADEQAEAAKNETGEAEEPSDDGDEKSEDADATKKRSRRRRGGRGRGRKREDDAHGEEEPSDERPSASEEAAAIEGSAAADEDASDDPPREDATTVTTAPEAEDAEPAKKKRRRRNRGRTTQPPGTAYFSQAGVPGLGNTSAPASTPPKPRAKAEPNPPEAKPLKTEKATAASDSATNPPTETPASQPTAGTEIITSAPEATEAPAKKVTAKKTARKTAKKATKKTAKKVTKKTPAKKAVKKATAKKTTAKKVARKATKKAAKKATKRAAKTITPTEEA